MSAPVVYTASVSVFACLDAMSDLSGLQDEVRNLLKQEWIQHINRLDYEGEWDVLPLRCEQKYIDSHPILQAFAIENGATWRDLPSLTFCPSIGKLLQSLKCPVGAVRLMRLRPDAEIRPHRDKGLSIEHGEARLHLPVFMPSGVSFFVEEVPVPMKEGELWYINADLTHSVRNLSQEDRINLVIDCEANDWLRNKIAAACPSDKESP